MFRGRAEHRIVWLPRKAKPAVLVRHLGSLTLAPGPVARAASLARRKRSVFSRFAFRSASINSAAILSVSSRRCSRRALVDFSRSAGIVHPGSKRPRLSPGQLPHKAALPEGGGTRWRITRPLVNRFQEKCSGEPSVATQAPRQ